MANIILTGGGTAGHCIPHLAILPHLKGKFDNIYYVGSENGIERSIIEKTDIKYYHIPCAKLNRNLTAKNLKIPFSVLCGIIKANKLIDELKPNVIFSKGGYVSLPLVIAAKNKNVPVIAHESDYTIGLANKISAKYCKLVLTSFPDTAKQINNGKFVGSPIRRIASSSAKKDYSYFGFDGNKPILLVTGGSLGAKALNDAVRSALDDLLAKFDVIHLCGKNNLIKNPPNKGYYQAEFLSEIDKAYNCASVCVSRAGSNTLFEMMSIKMPCVLIPLPKGASRGDQILNANYFQRLGLAYNLPQENLTKESLIFAINSTYANRYNLNHAFNSHSISDASKEIAKIIISQ